MEIVGKSDLGIVALGLGLVYFLSRKNGVNGNGNGLPIGDSIGIGNGFGGNGAGVRGDDDSSEIEDKEPRTFSRFPSGVVTSMTVTDPLNGLSEQLKHTTVVQRFRITKPPTAFYQIEAPKVPIQTAKKVDPKLDYGIPIPSEVIRRELE